MKFIKSYLAVTSMCISTLCFAQHYAPLGVGVDNSVRSLFTDTVANLLYIGGSFTNGGGISGRGIVSWNGINWDTLALGLDNDPQQGNFSGYPLSMCRYNNELYIGGSFSHAGTTNANSMAYWDGTTWYAMSSEPNGTISSMLVYNNELYVCGIFDSVNGIHVNSLAKWNGSVWSDVNSFPQFSNPLFSLTQASTMALYQGNLYVGGNFQDSIGYKRIVYWNGTQWHNLPNGGILGGNAGVNSMVVYNNELYVAGLFFTSDGNAGNSIQKWDGTNWSDVGGGMGGTSYPQIDHLKVIHNKLYAVGVFFTAGGVLADRIASWDGTNWCGFGDTFDNTITAIESYHDSIFIGGGFWTIDGDTINRIAKWIGGNYTANCTTTGVKEKENNEEISIYPNPSNGAFTINLNKEYKNVEIEITDVIGQVIYNAALKETTQTTVQLNVKSGIYFIEVKTEAGIMRKKLVKE